MTRSCGFCGAPLAQPVTGRPRDYCDRGHQEKAYRARQAGWPPGLEQAEERVVRLVADGHTPSWLAVEALAHGWRAAT